MRLLTVSLAALKEVLEWQLYPLLRVSLSSNDALNMVMKVETLAYLAFYFIFKTWILLLQKMVGNKKLTYLELVRLI